MTTEKVCDILVEKRSREQVGSCFRKGKTMNRIIGLTHDIEQSKLPLRSKQQFCLTYSYKISQDGLKYIFKRHRY